MTKRRERKRHGFRNFLIFCLIVAAIYYIGTFTLKTTEVTVTSDKVSDEITFVQITDLHGATFGRENRYLLKKIRDIDPDFIIATGDMYTSGDAEGQQTAVDLLGALAKDYTVYSVNGEHDYDSDYEGLLTEAGVDVLDYETRTITVGNSTINLYGITNVYYSDTFDLTNEFTIDDSKFNLLAAHITNFEAFAEFGVDLSVCGDTHGGQVRIPFLGALINRGIWLPEESAGEEKYVHGLYTMEGSDSKLFVSAGLGNYPVRLRFWNRPEVAVIHITEE